MSLYTKITDLQKLGMAWDKVKKNKPAEGVDEITYEDFENGRKEYLKQLFVELQEHRYHSNPVKNVKIYKGEKEREISLYCMRDKVVHQAIASEIAPLFQNDFSGSVYSYRQGSGALQAIQYVEEIAMENSAAWMLKTDIEGFFDHIILKKLYSMLGEKIKDQDVMDLIRECCEAKTLQRDGLLNKKKIGLYQGMGLSPLFSNIYLREFDWIIEEKVGTYIRYSDDILILEASRETLEADLNTMQLLLKNLGLMLKEKKTQIVELQEGVDFLGYHISTDGKSIPEKAENQLKERMEELWLKRIPVSDKARKGAEILQGWEQYFRGDREVNSIFEYVTVLYMVQNKDDSVWERIRAKRAEFQNDYHDVLLYLLEMWEKHSDLEMMLFEYEQYYDVLEYAEEVPSREVEPLLRAYNEMLNMESKETMREVMQMYSDYGCYQKATFFMGKIEQLQDRVIPTMTNMCELHEEGAKETKHLQTGFVRDFLELFTGREDTYGKEEISYGQKRCVEQVAEPLTEEVVKEHLQGNITVSTYLKRNNLTARHLIIDVDISKKVLITGETNQIDKYLPKAAIVAKQYLKELQHMGLKGYPEFSGFRGYHIWVFFEEWIPVRYISMLSDVIKGKVEIEGDEIMVEFFPNQSRAKNGSPGQSIKMPLGYHVHSGNYSKILDENFQVIPIENLHLKEIAKYSLSAVRKIVGKYTDTSVEDSEKVVEMDLQAFGEIPDSLKVVLENCNLMRYLCQKARLTGYLTHLERLSILYVFGHLGEEGKQFVHTVMEFTLNYQFHITDKFIQRLPSKPISCLKLRDQYKQITAEYGCSCNFRRSKNCYPSPVLHAIKSSEDVADDVTLPISRSLSKAKEKEVVEELNIHKKVQELTKRIVDMKKQKRGIDKSIEKTESELEKIFDQAKIDCLEVDMGMLVRRKKEAGYEWLIEI